MENMNWEKINGNIDDRIAVLREPKEVKPVRCFTMQTVEGLKGMKNAIYVIQQVGGDPEVTFKAFEAEKKSKEGKINYPRPNAPSEIMYVGSSTTDLMARIKQHTGENTSQTHALWLAEWYDGDYKIEIIKYADDIPPAVIQIIEDAISSELQPAFGKQGGNNK